MADRTPLKVADHNDIADDDPFAELTRIMGFDPRQPVRHPAPAVEKATPANQAAEADDFDIDLEKELMGEFDSIEESAPVAQQAVLHQIRQEPAFEAASIAANDDELTASFEQDFVFDDAADHADFAVARAPRPDPAPAPHVAPEQRFAPEPQAAAEPEVGFDDDFDKAVANSLDVSRFENDLPIDQEMAASLDQDFQLDHHAPADLEHREPVDARQGAAEAVQAASEGAFDVDFDNAVQMSLEDELSFESHEPQQHARAVEPVDAHAAAPLAPEDDLAGHFEQAMTDVDLGLGRDMDHGQDRDFQEPELSLDDERAPMVEQSIEAAHFAAEPDHAAPEPLVAQSLEDDFELSFRDALHEEPQAPAVEPAAASQPAATAPVPVVAAAVPPIAAVEPAKPASERSLEDELNALLGAMTARPMPTVKEPDPAPRPVAQPAGHTSGNAVADDLDWDIDVHQRTQGDRSAQPAESDLDDLLASELDGQDFAAPAKAGPSRAEPSVDFDDDAFGAAFANSIEAEQEAAATAKAPASSSGWSYSTPAEPAKSWSRSTPTAAPAAQASFAAQPAPAAPVQMAAPAYRSEPAVDYSAYAKPAQPPVPAPQPRKHDDMPDVETIDVPERVVALADDLDIPELSFEEDQPAAAAYDDLDAEFASLLTDMNATEIASAPAQNRGYDDDSYNAGFNGYDRRDLRAEAPAAPAAPASFAVANDYDADDLPGSRPVSQPDEFATDELDYDPELEEAMAIPGLAEREAAQPRRRGTMIAALVGAVVVLGGLGVLAFSFGGKGGSEAPVIVKADNSPIKVKPENPGGTVVPNQDNKVYDAVAKGGGTAKPAAPMQQKLVNTTEQPVDLASKEPPQSRVVDLSPNDADAGAGAAAAGKPDAALPGVAQAGVPESAQAAVPQSAQAAVPQSAQAAVPDSAQPAAPAPKSEDRIAQVLQQDAGSGTNNDAVAVAPRKVKTMMVKPDGSLVPREDPAPAAPKVAAAEPSDPAPQHVAPASDGQQTGTVASDADQADTGQADAATVKPAKPAKKVEAKAQSSNTPAKVPVAPARPSDQPVDIVGEVKPDQVASIDPAAAAGGGSWSMQIASQPTVESAQSTYQDLQRRYGSVLSGRTASIVKAEVAGKGTFYRVRVPAKSRNDAIALCTSYKAAGGNCFVSR